jgi:hypothetical protein
VDFAFAAIAFVAGWSGASVWTAALVGLAAAIAWAWMRRRTLVGMAPARLAASTAVALAVLAIVLGGAYWLGLTIRGNG